MRPSWQIQFLDSNKLYTVRPGDTLTGIAQLANVPYADLLALNPQISNPNLIRIGDMIVLQGTVSRSDLLARTARETFPGGEPDWLKIARREIGVAERNPGNNPRILEYLATTTLPHGAKQMDETAWCSAFANWCMKVAGQRGTNSAWALDWQNWGSNLAQPRVGAITVFSRKSASESGGHVGFFLRDLGASIEILGGNQNNRVSITSYPKNGRKGSFTYGFRAYRWV